jgi:hypothetical protein
MNPVSIWPEHFGQIIGCVILVSLSCIPAAGLRMIAAFHVIEEIVQMIEEAEMTAMVETLAPAAHAD